MIQSSTMTNQAKKLNSKLIKHSNNTKNYYKKCNNFQMFQHSRQLPNSTPACSPISILCLMCQMMYSFKHQEGFISSQLSMHSQIVSFKAQRCL
jgi:hypothetical protein